MLPLYPELPPQIYDGLSERMAAGAGFIERQPLYQLYLLNRSNPTCSVASIWWRRNARWRRCYGPRRHNVPGRRSAPHSWFRPAGRLLQQADHEPGDHRNHDRQDIRGKYCRKMVWCGSVMRASSCWRVAPSLPLACSGIIWSSNPSRMNLT